MDELMRANKQAMIELDKLKNMVQMENENENDCSCGVGYTCDTCKPVGIVNEVPFTMYDGTPYNAKKSFKTYDDPILAWFDKTIRNVNARLNS